jgi:hypothetical protein
MSTTEKSQDRDKRSAGRQAASKTSKRERDASGIGAASLIEAPIQATGDACRILSGKALELVETVPARKSTAKRVLVNLRATAQNARRNTTETG